MRRQAIDDFHLQLYRELLKKSEYRKWWKVTIKQELKHDTNVVQTPDSDVSVSNKDGTSSISKFTIKTTSRKIHKYGSYAFALDLGKTHHFRTSFKDRNSENLTATLNNTHTFKKKKLLSMTHKLATRSDWLKSTGSKEHSFQTWTLGTSGIVQPIKKKKWKLMNLLIPVFSADLEYRDYLGSDKLDELGREKDGFTPSLTGIILGMKKGKKRTDRYMGILNVRNTFTDADDFAFLNARLGLSYTAKIKNWEWTPNLAFVIRSQDNYQNQSRFDRSLELGAKGKYAWIKDRLDLTGSIKHTHQDSDFAVFNYENTSFSLTLQCQL